MSSLGSKTTQGLQASQGVMSLEQCLQTAPGTSGIPQTLNHALLNDLKVTFDVPSSAV